MSAELLRILPEIERPAAAGLAAPIVENRAVGRSYVSLTLLAPSMAATALPGQFVMLTAARGRSDVPVLPRPMAIYSADPRAGTITVVYAVRGQGTRLLSTFQAGVDTMYVVGPLGRGFEIADTTSKILLIGRGIGTCSLTTVAEYARHRGIEVVAVSSARSAEDLLGRELYEANGASEVFDVVDTDGSSDPEMLSRILTEAFDSAPPELVLTCGSRRLEALSGSLASRWGAGVQVSLEAHMACGLGYCHGCASGAVPTGQESPLVCLDGPVFERVTTAV